jgi:hypothetical protein
MTNENNQECNILLLTSNRNSSNQTSKKDEEKLRKTRLKVGKITYEEALTHFVRERGNYLNPYQLEQVSIQSVPNGNQ